MNLKQQWEEGKRCAVGIPKRQRCSFKRKVFKRRDFYDGLEQITCALSISFEMCACVLILCVAVHFTYKGV